MCGRSVWREPRDCVEEECGGVSGTVEEEYGGGPETVEEECGGSPETVWKKNVDAGNPDSVLKCGGNPETV